MATKHIYLGNEKWCYTENCELHEDLHLLRDAYLYAAQKNNFKALKRVELRLDDVQYGQEALYSFKVQAFVEKHGRKPKIGLDLDGTTGNFNQGIKEHMLSQENLPENISAFEADPSSYAMWEGEQAWFSTKDEFYAHFYAAENAGLYRNLKAYNNSSAVLRELKNYGFDIDAVTARLKKFNDDTSYWLKEENMPVYRIFNPGTEKASIPNIDVYIDDAPHVIHSLIENNKNVIVMNQAYNNDIQFNEDFTRRVNAWDKVLTDSIFELLETNS